MRDELNKLKQMANNLKEGDIMESLAVDVLDRLARLETKMDIMLEKCTPCQDRIHSHDISIATIDAKSIAAHRRIDNVYKTAGYIAAGVGLVVETIINLAKVFIGG